MDQTLLNTAQEMPVLFIIGAVIISIAAIVIGGFVIYIKFIQPNLTETVKCNDCTYKVINKSMMSHLSTATDMLGDANGMLSAQNVKIDQLDNKIDKQSAVLERVANIQDKTADTLQELFIRYKIQHKD